MAQNKTPEESWQPPRHMWSLIRAAHFVKVNCPPEMWVEFLRGFATTEQFEILHGARGRPGELLEYKQGRASLTWELGVVFDRATELWQAIELWVANQEKQKLEETESGRTVVPPGTVNGV